MTLTKAEQISETDHNSVSKKSKIKKRKIDSTEGKKSSKKQKLADHNESADELKTKHKIKSGNAELKQSSKKAKLFNQDAVSDEPQIKHKANSKKAERKWPFKKAKPFSQDAMSDEPKTDHKRKHEGSSTKKSFVKKGKFTNKKFTQKIGGKTKLRFAEGNNKRKWEKSENSSPEKVKLFNMKKKERKAFRQKAKKNFDVAKKLKVLWEELRRDNIEEERKQQLLKEISSLVKGHALQLIFAHDTVRVIECLVAVGTEAHRATLFEELKDSIIPLAKSRYAKFFVIKILRYGTQEQKACVMKMFHSKVLSLLKHLEAVVVVETAFNECANATQRAELVQEFYGPHFMYFKDSKIYNLAQLLETKPEQKTSIIEHMKSSLERVLQKGAHKYSIIHYVLREFMTSADPASRTELIECLQKIAAEVLHTKDGSRAIMSCIWHGSAKTRKVIIKGLKGHISKIAQEEFGHLVLLAIFDCVDDTRLVEKHIILEIVKDGKAIFLNQYGRKVLAYLISPRDPLYFHPDVISILKQGDDSATSKKDTELRKSELKDISSPLLLKVLLDNMEDLILDNACCLLITTILKHSSGHHAAVFQSLAKHSSQPYFPPEENSVHFIESNTSSLLLKKLITADKEKKGGTFSEILINEVSHGNFQSWIECNRGAFLLVNLLETEIPCVVERIMEEMKDLKEVISRKSYTGAKILFKMLIKDK